MQIHSFENTTEITESLVIVVTQLRGAILLYVFPYSVQLCTLKFPINT